MASSAPLTILFIRKFIKQKYEEVKLWFLSDELLIELHFSVCGINLRFFHLLVFRPFSFINPQGITYCFKKIRPTFVKCKTFFEGFPGGRMDVEYFFIQNSAFCLLILSAVFHNKSRHISI